MVMRICFLIRSLNRGGSERQLIELVKRLDPSQYKVTVLTFYPGGELLSELRGQSHIELTNLGKKGRWDVVRFLIRFVQEIRRIRPAILHSYLDSANLLSLVARCVQAKLVIIWGVRTSYLDLNGQEWLVWFIRKVERIFPRFATAIICNSEAGRREMVENGFLKTKTFVVPNGIDTQKFLPAKKLGGRLRQCWGVPEDGKLIGLVGRLDPLKDHTRFLKAAALLTQKKPNTYFVCVVGEESEELLKLKALGKSLGIEKKVYWETKEKNMTAVYNALDILASSSYVEGFSNSIGEAMACGIPCVVTDVGDSRQIVRDSGIVVPSRDEKAFARGLEEMMGRLNDSGLGSRARKRIEENFTCHQLVQKTSSVLQSLVKRARSKQFKPVNSGLNPLRS